MRSNVDGFGFCGLRFAVAISSDILSSGSHTDNLPLGTVF